MSDRHADIIGIIPAAGRATRIAPLPCSKEIYPIGFHRHGAANEIRPKVAGHYLLEKMRIAGADRAYIVISDGKWDIPKYFGDGAGVGMHLGYLMVDPALGTPFSVNQAHPFTREATIVFGYPDILFKPDNAYVLLLEKLNHTGAVLVLGLFEAHHPQKMDMVKMDEAGRIRDIHIKPERTNLKYTWIIAAWRPVFSDFLNQLTSETTISGFSKTSSRTNRYSDEIFIGDVIRSALAEKMNIEYIIFREGKYLDIGTPEDLRQVSARFPEYQQQS